MRYTAEKEQCTPEAEIEALQAQQWVTEDQ